MLDRIEKGEKQKLTLWMGVDVVKLIQQRALDQGKTLSKYISDLVTGEGER